MLIRDAFYAQFPDPPMAMPVSSPGMYCVDIFVDYIIVHWRDKYYKISFAMGEDGKPEFVDQSQWVEVVEKREWTEVVKSLKAMEKPLKSGRVLAARNAARIMQAFKLLNEALADAGLMELPEEIIEEDETESTAPVEKVADNEREQKAGPVMPPTSELLRLIEIEIEQIKTLEV